MIVVVVEERGMLGLRMGRVSALARGGQRERVKERKGVHEPMGKGGETVVGLVGHVCGAMQETKRISSRTSERRIEASGHVTHQDRLPARCTNAPPGDKPAP